jgi:hypothetical protein
MVSTATLERLTAVGVMGRPRTAQRPRTSGRRRVRSRAGHSHALAIGDPDLVVAAWDRPLPLGAQAAGLRIAPAQLDT